ncbi:hypothetical protein [Methanofollis sp. W23]|uniref:hypothetical protein n=1 Tax=Methanofollis sp. W23 TaxID=2817849 RepID=UPI001AE61798|nr:hypothetical protein [Methanofollis sp. W23]
MSSVRFLKHWSPFIIIGLLCFMLVPASASAAESGVTVDLDKVYSEKGMSVSSIEVLDLADPSVSRAELLPTDGNDLKTLTAPEVRYLTRSYTGDGPITMRGATITLNPTLKDPVEINGAAKLNVYTALHVPTPKVNVPGNSGNVLVGKYNNTYTCPEDEEQVGFEDLLGAMNGGYLYAAGGIAYDTPEGRGTYHITVNPEDLGSTLINNEVILSPFTAKSEYSKKALPPTQGKYALTAIQYLPGDKKVKVLASYPVVILDKDSSLTWNGKTTPSSVYNNRASDVTLSFEDRNDVEHIGYVIIRQGTTYDLDAKVDVDTLLEDVDAQGFTSANSFLEILTWGVTHELGKDQPVTYTVKAVGKSAEPSTEWSDIAITPGYGCSGYAAASSATVPKAALNSLGKGTYAIYAVGLNDEHDIVALDQKTLTVKRYSPSDDDGPSGRSPTGPSTPSEPSTPGADLWTSFSLSGATFESTDDGQTFSIDLDEATGVKVDGNVITFKKDGMVFEILASDLKEDGTTIAGTITSVKVKADPIKSEVEGLGDVSAQFTAEFASFPVNATIGATLVENVSENVVSAYSLALLDEGLDVSEVAYTLKVTKKGIEATGPATITMTAPPEWVTSSGGMDQIRILRLADDGTTQVLETVFKGYDADGNYLFEAVSPEGLSEIGLVAVTESTGVTVRPTDVGSGVETTETTPSGEAGAGEGLPVGWIAALLVAIVALVGVGYYLQKKGGDEKKDQKKN